LASVANGNHVEVSDGRQVRTDQDLCDTLRSRRWLYRSSTAVLVAVVGVVMVDGAALVDVVGVDSAEVRRQAPDGSTLLVEFPSVTRPALASPLRITVGGLAAGERVTLGIDRQYLAMWDHNAVFPAPDAERSVEPWVVWEYVASGTQLVIELDLRVEPGAQWGRTGHVSMLDHHDLPIVTAYLHTRVMP
jgi:hypothetical protein